MLSGKQAMIQNDDDIIRQKGGKAMTVEERLEAIEKELHGRNAQAVG